MSKSPTLTPMDSSVISAHHYDPATSKLTIEFKNGSTWQYSDVPMEKAEAFRENASPGRFFGAKIKGLYPGKLIG